MGARLKGMGVRRAGQGQPQGGGRLCALPRALRNCVCRKNGPAGILTTHLTRAGTTLHSRTGEGEDQGLLGASRTHGRNVLL